MSGYNQKVNQLISIMENYIRNGQVQQVKKPLINQILLMHKHRGALMTVSITDDVADAKVKDLKVLLYSVSCTATCTNKNISKDYNFLC